MVFSEELMKWYQQNKRLLPWRDTKDPYKVWLSEVILQQTRVAQGLPYYLRFVEAYPSVFHLAEAPFQEVLKHWQGLGYYNRAQNLHKTARYIVGQLKGVFPQTYASLLGLKGIGDYTASAIASICFDEPCPVIDGNVYRVLARYFGVEVPINSSEGKKYFRELAHELLYGQDPATYNQAIMEFGAVQCKPRLPGCGSCVFNTSCMALQKGQVEKLPVKVKTGRIKKRFFNYLVVTNGRQTLLNKRSEKDIWQYLYEFPLVETQEEAKKEQLLLHPDLKKIVPKKPFKVVLYNPENIIHKLSHQHLYARFWIVHTSAEIKGGIAVADIKKYPVPILIANFVGEYFF